MDNFGYIDDDEFNVSENGSSRSSCSDYDVCLHQGLSGLSLNPYR